jgi:hypothetical protein
LFLSLGETEHHGREDMDEELGSESPLSICSYHVIVSSSP